MASQARDSGVSIELLGGFRVFVGGDELAAHAWATRRAAELVQLLALADDHRLTRDEVIEALWPHLDADAGAANLRKAAHHARQALADPEAVVLRGGQVALFPARSVETDVGRFEAEADASLYTGELLPEARYEDWTQTRRESLRSQAVELLRLSGELERLVEVDPTDEPAYRDLMRRELEAGSRPAAIRWYGRLRNALRRELGIPPSAETKAIYDECVAGLGTAEPAFVGRQLELARATALLRGDPGEMLAVRGPAGIGKSAFCRELARVATAEEWAVIDTQATEESAPYTPLVRVVEQVQARDPSAVEELRSRGRAVVAELTAPSARGERPLTRHQVIGAVRRLLLAAGGGAAVALVVDDAHLADTATIDVLHHIGSASGTPLLPILAYRPEAAPEPLTRGVARLARAGKAVEIDLQPLDREDAAALVAVGTPIPRPGDVIDRIVDLAEGNPFLTLELARSAVAGVPALVATARDAIVSRFLDLEDDTVATLRRLALASDDLDPSAVVALTGSSEAAAFAVLDAALGAGILIVSGAHYRFRHELVRQALVEQLAPHERLVLHRDTAERLAGAGAEPGLIARHWLDGDRPGEAREWLLAAARQAVKLGAYADALGYLEPLLEHAPEHGEGLRLRAEALDALGDSRAPAAYAVAALVVGDAEAHNLRAKQALATIKLGDPPGGLAVLEGVEATSLEGRVAQALALSGAAALGFGDPAIGTAKAAQARRLALEAGDPDATVVASWAHAAAAHARGELRSSVQADLREMHALPKLAVSVFDGQLCMTQRFLYGARPYSEVIAFADSLAEEARRLGAARGHAFAVTIRGEAKLLAGQLDEADADLAAGAELHREIAAATGEAFALQRRAEVALHRGLHADALALLDEALAIARESDVGFHLLDRIYGTRVTAALDPASGLAALEEAESAVRGPAETCPTCRITLAVPAAIAAAQAGDLERLDQWEAAAEYLATVVMRLPAWDAALEEVRGHRAQASGDGVAAFDHFRTAADGFRASEQPLDEARCGALAARLAGDVSPTAPRRASASGSPSSGH
jgi:DNA-binding SARP family transcriptional activator/tetratricopeptide (TPR) repeat protein